MDKVILVGLGKWGCVLAKEANQLGFLEALVDLDEERLIAAHQALGSPKNVKVHGSLGQALELYPTAGVVVATPPSTHHAVACIALKAKRDVWVEKPICSTVEDAEHLVWLAAECRCILFVDHLLQYSLPHRVALDLVASGWIGNVMRVRAIRQNFGTVRTKENALSSLSPHDLSLVMTVCGGLPREVLAIGQSSVGPSGTLEDYVDVHLEYTNAQAHVTASWWHYEKERRLTVYGEKGCIVVNESKRDERPVLEGYQWTAKRHADGSRVIINKSEHDLMKEVEKYKAELGAEASERSPVQTALIAFIEARRSRKVPITDGKEGLKVLRVLSSASESLKTKERVVLSANEEEMESDVKCRKEGYESVEKTNGVSESEGEARNEKDQTTAIEVDSESNRKETMGIVEKSETSEGRDELGGMEKERRTGTGTEEAKSNGERYYVNGTAVVDEGAVIGEGTKVWHFSHVMSGAQIGSNCSLGQNCYVGSKVVLGNGVRVQNGVSLYDGIRIEDNVFLGPHCVFTNVKTPRADRSVHGNYSTTKVCRGATIGANATIVCGIEIGARAFIGASTVVTADVPAYALVYGNPGRVHGWVSEVGERLVVVAKLGDGRRAMQCPKTGESYVWQPAADENSCPSVVRQ